MDRVGDSLRLYQYLETGREDLSAESNSATLVLYYRSAVLEAANSRAALQLRSGMPGLISPPILVGDLLLSHVRPPGRPN